ncbi:Ig-like domain-containing protein [Paraglaciecola aquimarina]|uniref:Ig-like domain-containing protein n=1 Tax=Paraglaciecola aquimarina TaxID=1235557 RepID=A0ABU3SUA8_9ALTE|nr:Ig-like domain-containing protein [Paraglaciecola aquimarina]MDU0353557.1 Ig-like domain-containing protein [Paraglaciecola aquimarina]
MLKAIPWLLVTTGLTVLPISALAKTEAVVNLNVKHSVGGKDTFDRQKYITIHSTLSDNDWVGEGDQLKYLMDDLDVYFGRDNGGPGWNFNQAAEDPSNPGYADPDKIVERGRSAREDAWGVNRSFLHQYDGRGDIMVGGQPIPHWLGTVTPHANSGLEPWQAAGADAVGDFLGQYMNEFFRSEGEAVTDGHLRPHYFEVLNEPLYQLTDDPGYIGLTESTDPIDIFNFHKDVATAFRRHNTDVKIGGFTVAFPRFEVRDFDRWEERMKLFIDTAGQHMDFYSTHFYDLQPNDKFKGGRIEATLDMIDHYSLLALGETKEHVISEYGGRNQPLERDPWSPLRDWWFLKAASPMLIQFMDRPDTIAKTIPFIPVKAEWGRKSDTVPYPWRLFRRQHEGAGETGDDWVFTDMVKFYELWSDVKGTRVDSYTTNPDILMDSYVAQDKLYVIFSNLTEQAETLLLHQYGSADATIQGVKIKHLYLHGIKPKLDVINAAGAMDTFELAPEATAIIEYTYTSDINIDQTSSETKYFASEYLKDISASVANQFEISAVQTSELGEAILRIAVGRDHGKSLTPRVTFNGQILTSVAQISGDNQLARDRFFGLLEIPVPYDLVKQNNQVDITFPDAGGHIASVNMKVFNFDSDIRPEGGAVSGMFITAATDILPVGQTMQVNASVTPFFATDQTFVLSSSDDTIATVSSAGVVTGLKAGVVSIIATSTDGGFQAEVTVTVEEPVAASLGFDDRSVYLSTSYNVDTGMQVTTHYEAGTGYKVTSSLNGVKYLLRHMSSGWKVIKDIEVNDTSAIGKQRGTSTVNIPLDGLTPTDELQNGEFYFLFIRMNSSAGVTKEINAFPIKIEKDEGVIEPGLQWDDSDKYRTTTYTTDSTLDVVVDFEAGNGLTVASDSVGVRFYLREMDGTFTTVFNDVTVSDPSAVDQQSGQASASIPLDGLTPSTSLPEGHFYFLFAQFMSSDGATHNINGIAPINIEQGVVPASFTLDDINKYRSTEYVVGGTMDVTTNYEMGTGNTVTAKYNGIRYFLRHMEAGWTRVVKDIVVEDSAAIGSQSGVSQVSIPLAGATPSDELPAGDFYFLFIKVESSDGNEYDIPVSGITILPPASVQGDWDEDGDVDSMDVRGLMGAVLSRQAVDLAFDINGDEVVNMLDVRALAPMCTRARCATN